MNDSKVGVDRRRLIAGRAIVQGAVTTGDFKERGPEIAVWRLGSLLALVRLTPERRR